MPEYKTTVNTTPQIILMKIWKQLSFRGREHKTGICKFLAMKMKYLSILL